MKAACDKKVLFDISLELEQFVENFKHPEIRGRCSFHTFTQNKYSSIDVSCFIYLSFSNR